MQRKNLSTFGKLTLAGILSVSGCGNRIAPQTLPANNIDFGRHMEVYEEDAQQGINNSLDFGVESCRNGNEADVHVNEIEDRNGRKSPFDAYVDCKTDSNNKQKCELTIKDNSRFYVSGEIWNVKIRANCGNLDNDSIRTVEVTYLAGSSPDRLDDRLDNVEDEVFNYVVDDGKCESVLGENSINSPYDCRVNGPPVTQPSLLEKADTWSCNNLEAANDTNIRLYAVTPVNNGTTFTSREIAELIPGRNPEAGSTYELTTAGPTNSFYIAVGGSTPSGQRVGETIRGMMGYDDTKNPNAKMSSNVDGGYASNKCDIYFINSNPSKPTPQPMPDGLYTVFSDGD